MVQLSKSIVGKDCATIGWGANDPKNTSAPAIAVVGAVLISIPPFLLSRMATKLVF
jgi:hypothetical protein